MGGKRTDSETRNARRTESAGAYSVLEKAFEILDTFQGRERTLSLKEITDRSGLPKPTVHRICNRLVMLGLLVRTEGGFRLGMRLFKLGSQVAYARAIHDVTMPFLGDLQHTSRETVHLGIVEGLRITLIEKISDGRGIPLPSRVGGAMSPHSTALGKAVLAFSPTSLIEQVLSGGLRQHSPFTIIDPHALRSELEEIADRGYALDREEVRVGVNCIAAPIRGRDGFAFAGISVTGPTGRFEPERIAGTLSSCAKSVSLELRRRAVDLIVPNRDADREFDHVRPTPSSSAMRRPHLA